MKKQFISMPQLINYMVDVLGYGEDEAHITAVTYGTSYLTPEQLQECNDFNN